MTKESLKLKEGDRVAFYSQGTRLVGVVLSPSNDPNELCIRQDNGNTWFHVHKKCCRRLRPKKKPMRVEIPVSWAIYDKDVYPVNDDFNWPSLVGKKGTLVFTEGESNG